MADRDSRESPRLLDVTLRDGGYVNGHSFSLVEAERLVSTLAGAGLSLIEACVRDTRGNWESDSAPDPTD